MVMSGACGITDWEMVQFAASDNLELMMVLLRATACWNDGTYGNVEREDSMPMRRAMIFQY